MPTMDRDVCQYRELDKPSKGDYFRHKGEPCGMLKEVVESPKGARLLLCPLHDRQPFYVPPWKRAE